MELSISDSWLENAITKIVKKLGLVSKDEKLGRQIKIDDFRKRYCRGKSPEWVRMYIFDAFPETNFANGGWVAHPRSRPGYHDTTYIYEYDAAMWMEKHKHDIDWDAKVPVRS